MSIETLFAEFHRQQKFNGAALVANDGQVVYKGGWGLANVEWQIANTADTVFRIGSLTKQFTAMLVLQQVERGKLTLNGTIYDYLSWYRKDTGEQVSIRNLLTHSSGIPTFTTMEFVQKHLRDNLPVAEFVERFCSDDLTFQPGTAFEYSNSNYHILGAILEAVTGVTYDKLLETNILAPLGMQDSGYDWSEKVVPRRAAGYDRDGDTLRNTSFVDMSIPYAGGGMYSTVEDLFRWDRALAGHELLSPELTEIMFTPVYGNYACGWGVVRVEPTELAQYFTNPSVYQTRQQGLLVQRHEGGINGFHSMIIRLPEQGALVVLLSNMGDAPLELMAKRIITEHIL
ncbi:MAG: beta-lactamase family protein [Firmicutes bacterium]|nr:beta-lactamase family protein [Bacillota bacterium]